MPPNPARRLIATAVLGASTAVIATPVFETMLGMNDARACGVFQQEPATPTPSEKPALVTDHRMVVAIGENMTTLWDQPEYSGSAAEFAWVIPARGAVTIGAGSDDFISSLDDATAPEILSPRRRCSSGRDGCGGSSTAGCASSDSAEFGFEDGYQEDAGVHAHRTVAGPYAAVRVHGEDATKIVSFLRNNKYAVPTEIEPVVSKYVDEKFDFIAVRLRSGFGVGAMRPIRVSWNGVDPRLPLRMVKAGVSGTVGIKLLVVADQRWRTKNFPTFVVDPKSLTWDFAVGRSDRAEVVARQAALFEGRAFAMESSLDLTAASVADGPADLPLPVNPSDAGVAAADTAAGDAALGDTATGDVADAATDAADVSADDADEDGDLDGGAVDTGAEGTVDAAPDAPSDAPSDRTPLPDEDAGKGPVIAADDSDRDIAFGSHAVRRVTRLRAQLPAEFLDQDLELELDPNPLPLTRTLQVEKSSTSQVCPTTASVAGEGAAPIRATLGLVLAALGAVLARRAARRG